LLVIRLDGLLGHRDEIIQKSSGRLARHGTYTSREDIPRYEKSENSLPRIVNQMPTVIDELERKQQAKLQISDEQSEAYPNSTSQGALKLDSHTEQRSTKVLTEEEVSRIRLEDQLVEQII
jgi:hypothetical protein